jgi:hypothetical protein
MVQSLTVVGGNFTPPGTTVGLVTAPSTGIPLALNTSLQSLLTSISGAVSLGAVNFDNVDLATVSGNVSPTQGVYSTGLLDLSNTNPDGSTVAGMANASLTEPAGYNVLFVQAPGTETIAGNGASNALVVIGDFSSVNYYTDGGSGTVVASSSGDYVGLIGSDYSFIGSNRGGDSVLAAADGSSVSTFGAGSASTGAASNVVGISGTNVSVASSGTNDLVEMFNDGSGVISMAGGGNVLIDGGLATVYATAGSSSVNAFFEHDGGELYFVNQSSVAATVSGGINGAIGGNVTAFGGAGGGVYVGGIGGENSLVGGTGTVTLYGGGATSTLVGAGTLSGGTNSLFANTSGSVTMIGATGSSNNNFSGSTGTLVVSSNGSGYQNYFVGGSGQESFTGSTVSGAHNIYYFDQDSTGSGSDIITNFNFNTDSLKINAFSYVNNVNTGGVSISGIYQNNGAGGGVLVELSNQTTIKLYGVSLTAADNASVASGGYSL